MQYKRVLKEEKSRPKVRTFGPLLEWGEATVGTFGIVRVRV